MNCVYVTTLSRDFPHGHVWQEKQSLDFARTKSFCNRVESGEMGAATLSKEIDLAPSTVSIYKEICDALVANFGPE